MNQIPKIKQCDNCKRVTVRDECFCKDIEKWEKNFVMELNKKS